MKIGITNDHRGLILKQSLTNFLKKEGYNIIDYGTNTDDPVDYPDYACKLGNAINNKEVDLGIAICSTGIGMDICLNKIKNIRSAKVSNKEEAYLSRFHNDANVLTLSSKVPSMEALEIAQTFLSSNFSNEPRHKNRIAKISEIENA